MLARNFLISLGVAITFLGCISPSKSPYISKLILDVTSATLPKSKYKLLKSQEELNRTILGLKKIGHKKQMSF